MLHWKEKGKQLLLTEVDGADLLSFLDLLFVAAHLFYNIKNNFIDDLNHLVL